MSLWVLVLHLTFTYTCMSGSACPETFTTTRMVAQYRTLDLCEEMRERQQQRTLATSRVTEVPGARLTTTVDFICEAREVRQG